MNLLNEMPKPGFGTNNNGYTARRFFKESADKIFFNEPYSHTLTFTTLTLIQRNYSKFYKYKHTEKEESRFRC